VHATNQACIAPSTYSWIAIVCLLQAAIESLLCARVSDGFINDKHNPNTELIAQV
jgi:MFS superfamily sulfate permease-like transporter